MKKERQTTMYESPITKETQVKLESGICTGSYRGQEVEVASGSDNGGIEEHGKNNDFSGTFTNSGWD